MLAKDGDGSAYCTKKNDILNFLEEFLCIYHLIILLQFCCVMGRSPILCCFDPRCVIDPCTRKRLLWITVDTMCVGHDFRKSQRLVCMSILSFNFILGWKFLFSIVSSSLKWSERKKKEGRLGWVTRCHHLVTVHIFFAPCKVPWVKEAVIGLRPNMCRPHEAPRRTRGKTSGTQGTCKGIWEILACGFQIPGLWIPEYSLRNPESH